MARVKHVTGTLKVMQELTRFATIGEGACTKAVQEVSAKALEKAKEKLSATKTTQKWGKTLADQIGLQKRKGVAKIYAPIDDTLEMRNQMYYAEYGAGVVGGDIWWYRTTPHDDNPTKHHPHRVKTRKDGTVVVKERTNRLVAFTDYSKPAHYMAAARRYINKHARARTIAHLQTVLTRKPNRRRVVQEE